MKKRWLSLLCAIFALFLLFTGIGYATMSRVLISETKLSLDPPPGLFITSVTATSGTSATIERFTGTTLTSTVTLGNSVSSTGTLTVKIYNNSNTVYAFDQVLYSVGESTYDNEGITFSLSGIKQGQKLAGYGTATINVIFSYKNGVSSNRSLFSILNFNFTEYIPDVADHFSTILNTEDMMTKLIDRMDTTGGFLGGNRTDDSYIGNVVGATSADSALLNELFTVDGSNKLQLPNISANVTAMIKRENVDGSTATGDENGNEMTLYMTADVIGNADVTVYAIVFTKLTADSEWTQIGEMYQGTAETNNYIYNNFGSPNSFNTSTWKSSLAYHGAAVGSSISAIIAAFEAEQA